jgi:hypothetical protein
MVDPSGLAGEECRYHTLGDEDLPCAGNSRAESAWNHAVLAVGTGVAAYGATQLAIHGASAAGWIQSGPVSSDRASSGGGGQLSKLAFDAGNSALAIDNIPGPSRSVPLPTPPQNPARGGIGQGAPGAAKGVQEARPPGTSLFDPGSGALAQGPKPGGPIDILDKATRQIPDKTFSPEELEAGLDIATLPAPGPGKLRWLSKLGNWLKRTLGIGKVAKAAPRLFSTAETEGLRNLFGTGQKGAEEALKRVSQGGRDLPTGVTRDTLGRYKQQIIDKGLQDIPVQRDRLRVIEELLK